MGRFGYMGCLVFLGVALVSVSCLAIFGAAGAINADRGASLAAAPKPAATLKPGETPSPGPEPRRTLSDVEPTKPAEPGAPKPAATAMPTATVPPKAGPQSFGQRLDIEAVGGGYKLKALGWAKTVQGETAVAAIFVRIENDSAQTLRVDPVNFKLTDGSGARYPITRAIEQTFPAVDLGPKAAGEPGKFTEGSVAFEIPRTAVRLALTYELPQGQPIRVPLPPDFDVKP